ncbi:MAG TPA: hypothetical protein VI337_04380 [Nitrospirales bacterium]|nr:hypothetical protein [Nitrospirales bacterium]
MPADRMIACYDSFLKLMDRTDEALDRKDLDEVARLDQLVRRLVAEIETFPFSSGSDSADPETAAGLEATIRQALDRVNRNQVRITQWIEETKGDLGRLQKGSVAVRGYATPPPTGPLLVERKA